MTTLFFLSGVAALFLLFVIFDYKTGFSRFTTTLPKNDGFSDDLSENLFHDHGRLSNTYTNPHLSVLPDNTNNTDWINDVGKPLNDY